MALNIDTQDLVNFPGNTKRITIDLDSLVPIGNEGDELFVLSATTSTYSNNEDRTAIPDLYITDICAGWVKSSGFAGAGGKYNIDATHKSLKIKMDATVSGVDGAGYYQVDLTPNDDQTPLTGEIIAAELEVGIRAVADNIETIDIGFAGAYRNASVEYKNGKFWIISGSIASAYTGSNRTSVLVLPASTNDCSQELGFNLPTSSAQLAGIAIKETIVSLGYTADTDTLYVNTGTGASVGMAFVITDGDTTDYFTALSGTTDAAIKIATNTVNGFTGISNDYVAGEAKLQLLKEQDPEGVPTNWYDSMDQLVRFGIKSISKQIDYSS